MLDLLVLCTFICISACICIFEKEQGPNISVIATDVIKCYQMTDAVQRACGLKPLCFSNISSLIIIVINHNHHKIDKYTFLRKNTAKLYGDALV